MCTSIVKNGKRTIVGFNLDILGMQHRVNANADHIFIEILDEQNGWLPLFGVWKKSFQTQTNLLKKAGYGATLSGYTVSYIPTVLRNAVLMFARLFSGEPPAAKPLLVRRGLDPQELLYGRDKCLSRFFESSGKGFGETFFQEGFPKKISATNACAPFLGGASGDQDPSCKKGLGSPRTLVWARQMLVALF